MRYIKDILLEVAYLYQMDDDIKLLDEIRISEENEMFIRKHVIKSLNSDKTNRIKLKDGPVKEMVTDLQKTGSLKVFANRFSKYYYDKTKDMDACDLLFIRYIANEKRVYGLLKLNYEESFSHAFREDEVILGNIALTLPGIHKSLKKCLFISEEEVLMIDVKDHEEEDYFRDLIGLDFDLDNTHYTRAFKYTIDKWIQKYLNDQIILSNQVKDMTDEILENDEKLDMKVYCKLLQNCLGDDQKDLLDGLYLKLSRSGIKSDLCFEIDQYVVKSTSKSIKTDTGLIIKGDKELFKDSQRFVSRDNGDGTIDIIIKSIRNMRVS